MNWTVKWQIKHEMTNIMALELNVIWTKKKFQSFFQKLGLVSLFLQNYQNTFFA